MQGLEIKSVSCFLCCEDVLRFCKLCDFHDSEFHNLMHSSFTVIIQGLVVVDIPFWLYEIACCSLAVISQSTVVLCI